MFLILCAFSFYFTKDVTGIMCFVCNSLRDPECVSYHREDRHSIHYMYCKVAEDFNSSITEYKRPFCRKMVQKIRVRNNMVIINRSCGWILHKSREEDLCYENKNEDREEVVCQCFEDGCNSSWMRHPNSYLMLILFALLIILLSFQ